MGKYGLAAILNDIGGLDMGTFKGRLTLQKTVYLLQSFGVDLGYRFRWYLHGAYCTKLARDGFAIEGAASRMPAIPIEFEEDHMQSLYAEFKDFMADKKADPATLEIASSICYLDGCGLEKDEVLKHVEGKKAEFGREQCQHAWNELEKYRVVGHGSR